MQTIFLKAQDSGWYPQFLGSVVEVIHNDNQNKKILDVGTGPGKLPEMLIEKDSGLYIIGIDIDSSMIEEARKRLVHRNVSYQYEKINSPLDFADEEFDIITFCSVLFLVDDRTKTLLMNEALRVLKPGGKIIILTPSGKKPVLCALSEVWRYPFSFANWTFLVWRAFTTRGGRKWQKQKWLAQYSRHLKLTYTARLSFNNNASIEIITKTINN